MQEKQQRESVIEVVVVATLHFSGRGHYKIQIEF